MAKRLNCKLESGHEKRNDSSSWGSYCFLDRFCCWCFIYLQSLTAQTCSTLWTGTGVMRAACGSMLTGWDTGYGHRCSHSKQQEFQCKVKIKVLYPCVCTYYSTLLNQPVSQRLPVNPLAQRHLLRPTQTPPFLHGFWHSTGSDGDRGGKGECALQ